jgi:hypothetical protein
MTAMEPTFEIVDVLSPSYQVRVLLDINISSLLGFW